MEQRQDTTGESLQGDRAGMRVTINLSEAYDRDRIAMAARSND